MEFYSQYARILNSKQSRSVVLYGNIHDLFFDGERYVPLLNFLENRTRHPGNIQVTYGPNEPIRISDDESIKNAYIEYKSGKDINSLLIQAATAGAKQNISRVGTSSIGTRPRPVRNEYDELAAEFEKLKYESQGNTAVGLQFLRHLCDASRSRLRDKNLHIIIEAADMMLPSGKDIASLGDRDRRQIAIVQDWFCDPAFNSGEDSVTLIADAASLIHDRVVSLPTVLLVEVPAPNQEHRNHFIRQVSAGRIIHKTQQEQWDIDELARLTAGLSLQAISQLLLDYFYAFKRNGESLTPSTLVVKIERFIKSQVGDDIVEFKKPEHSLDDCVGFSKLKQFLRKHLIPRFRSTGPDALPGAAVGGPIGSGKTYLFEAVAAELGVPVIVLKNLRSQWYGQTDVIFERLRMVLEALEKVIIFVDEADTQFGSVDQESHSTERRLTGKIQSMMSDPRLRGRVTWLLMTARIHLLSPDIRRPGRVGDLIIPVLDPSDEDHLEFCKWVAGDSEELASYCRETTQGWSAAGFASLRSELEAAKTVDVDTIKQIIDDQIPPNIGPTREYQTLQALLNCTRKSLIPNSMLTHGIDKARDRWNKRLRELEAQGIR